MLKTKKEGGSSDENQADTFCYCSSWLIYKEITLEPTSDCKSPSCKCLARSKGIPIRLQLNHMASNTYCVTLLAHPTEARAAP